MARPTRFLHRVLVWLAALAVLAGGPAAARGPADDPNDPAFAERQARRLELRQQLMDERMRGRQPGQPGGYPGTMPPGGLHPPGAGPQGGGPGSRLSPDERRELRRELRQQRGELGPAPPR